MDDQLGNKVLMAIEDGTLHTEVIPMMSSVNPGATDLFEISLNDADEELGRVGVWKTAAGGTFGDGSPRVLAIATTVHVIAGERMAGSFDIECQLESQAEEVASLLQDRLHEAYKGIEVEIANS